MKLLFISDNYPPEQNALAQRSFSHIEIWKKKINIDLKDEIIEKTLIK